MYELNENFSNMTDTERILEIIRVKDLNNIQFCSATGISPASLSHITSNRSKPTLSILRNVIAGFPDINPEWVMMGTGPMFRSGAEESSEEVQKDPREQTRQSRPDNERMNSLFPDDPAEDVGKVRTRSHRDSARANNGMVAPGLEEVVKTTLSVLKQHPRRIVEVKVFYDDGTFESFGANAKA